MLFLLVALLTALGLCRSAFACTNVLVKATDGTMLIARSMEFAQDMHSNLRTSTRGRAFNSLAPDGKPGLTWKAKYGYVYLDGMNIDAVVDGMNEVGLSYGALLFPGFAQYPGVTAGHDNQALPYMSFGDWVLGNFKTVDEVKQALNGVSLYPNKLPGLGDTIFPLHYSITDATGKGIIVEYVEGKMHVYDSIGVLTNSPTYDWQVVNMANYLHLAPTNPPAVVANGITYAVTGQGYGMIGLPGDISPPSRFVKTTVLMRLAVPTADAAGALNMAEHILNNVDIPLGEAREPQSGNYIDDVTQWVVFKDLTHKVFYYRTYADLSLHAVYMNKLDFANNAPRLMMTIASKEWVQDMTHQFLGATSAQ